MSLRFSLFLLVIFFSLFVVTDTIFAQGAGIGLRPITVDERLEPGEVKPVEMTVSNISESEQLFYVFARNIASASDSGSPIFSNTPEEMTGYELAEWITFDTTELTVPAGEDRIFRFVITAPTDATPGSHFAGVFVSNDPPSIEQSGAAVGYQVASIVSVRIPGEAEENASIRQFSTDNFIYSSPNVEFTITIDNSGNTLLRPSGPLIVRNMFGSEVANLIFNESNAGVFPRRTRVFTQTWEGEPPGFGRYEAILSPVYGDTGARQTMSSTVVFWVLPMNIILPALGFLAVLLLITYFFARLYIRRKLSAYTAVTSGRRLVRKQNNNASAFVFITITVLIVTALFLLVLLVLFA